MSKALTITFGLCFAVGVLAASQAQIGPGGGGGGLANPVSFIQFGGTTSSFSKINACAQALATNRACVRLADDSNWTVEANGGVDLMSGANRQGFFDITGTGVRLSTDVGTSITLNAPASGGSGANGVFINGAVNDGSYSFQTPTTGFSITLANNIWHTILDPAGTLATGTITMAPNPSDGMIVNVRTSQTITGLTVSPNTAQSIKGNPTTLAAGGILECMFHTANTTWYC